MRRDLVEDDAARACCGCYWGSPLALGLLDVDGLRPAHGAFGHCYAACFRRVIGAMQPLSCHKC